MGLQHEIWRCTEPDGIGVSMGLARGMREAMERHCEGTLELLHSFEAASHFEAMRKYYAFMDWGPYCPEPDWVDEPYPAEEKSSLPPE